MTPYSVAQTAPDEGQTPAQTPPQQPSAEQSTPPGVSTPKPSGEDVQQAAATMYRDADAALKWGWEQAGLGKFEAPTTHHDRVVMAARIAAALKGEDLASFLGKMADAGKAFGVNWGLREGVTAGAPLNQAAFKSLDAAHASVQAQLYAEWAQGAGLSPTSSQTPTQSATPGAPDETASEVPSDAADPTTSATADDVSAPTPDPTASPVSTADAQSQISAEEQQQALSAIAAVLSQVDQDGNGSLSAKELATAAQGAEGDAKSLLAAAEQELQASGAQELPVAQLAQTIVKRLIQEAQESPVPDQSQPVQQEQSTREVSSVATTEQTATLEADIAGLLQKIDEAIGTKGDGQVTKADLQQAQATQGIDQSTAAVLGLGVDLMTQGKVDSASVQDLAKVMATVISQQTAQPTSQEASMT
jgi:hypothetical protein